MTRKTMYTAPRLELLSFAAEEVIATSGDEGYGTMGHAGNDLYDDGPSYNF